MKKRFLSLFLAIALICALLPTTLLTASAETYSGTCGGNLTWMLDTETGVLEITGTGEMDNWGWNGAPWYSYRESIQSVSIGNGVKSIGYTAFYNCTGLTSVTIPDSVTSIGNYAFYKCSGLTSVMIGNGVTSIGLSAFWHCTGLTSVTIPDSVTSIDDCAFEGCTGLTSVTIGSGVTSIDFPVFYGCTSLTSITVDAANAAYCSIDGVLYNKDKTVLVRYPAGKSESSFAIPDSVISIGGSAFSACSGLTSITIPDSVTIIAHNAFDGCTGLTSIDIPDSVTHIGGDAFYGCDALTSLTVDENNAVYDSRNNCNAIIKTAYDTLIFGCKSTAIPDSVTSISWYAFCGCTGLTSVTIPDSVTRIDQGAFYGCTGLTSVTIPDSVTRIGSSAFSGCTGLTSVTIGNGVTIIDGEAFADCSGLTSVTIGNGVTSIRGWAFRGCTGLTSVIIPDSVTSIDLGAFRGCTGLTSVTIPDSVTRIGDWAFYGCTGLTSVIIPDSVTSIGGSAFEGCTGLTSVTIPNSVTRIGSCAFAGCTGLTSVTIPNSVTSIGDLAFYDCTELTSITIPNSVTTIYSWTFGYYWDDEIKESVKIDGFTIYGYNDSAAHTYAENNGFIFVDLENMPCQHEQAHPEHKDATCTEPGYDRMVCDVCGAVISEEILPALGHDLVVDPAVPATCTATGLTEGKHCTRCDYKVAQAVVPTTAHTYKDGVCTVCGAKDPDYQPVTPPSTTFTDVKQTDWYYAAVNYAVTNGLMNGVGNNNFAPDDPMTRAMLVTVLWRYEGEKKEGTNTFTDVPSGQWYTDAVAWAAANGIVGGVGNNKFDPNGNITREQMAAILYRYANKKGFDTSKRGDLSKFPDAGKVSEWAKDPIAWAVAEGIIGGSDGKLMPQGNATRAQVSTILMRFIENAKVATPYDTQGHTYEFVRGMYSWEEAQKTAKEKGGYLVRFDSEEEFEYVAAELSKGSQGTIFIIGARRAENSKDYFFVDDNDNPIGDKLNTASAWTLAYWSNGEPTYEWEGAQEWIVAVEYNSARGCWALNDIVDNLPYPADPNSHGIIIEYEP